jgi:hypothetical protein
MRLKLQLLLVMLVLFTASNAQTNVYHPFPDSNAVWSVFNQKYFVSGDSTLNMLNYKKYFFSSDSIPLLTNGAFFALVREDTLAKRVWAILKDSANEKLLYDFSLEVNDTTTVFPASNFFYVPDGIKIIVEQSDSVLIDGQYRKRLKIIGADQNTYLPEYWIEGIGSTFGPFNSGFVGFIIFDAPYPVLICFEQDGQLLYHDLNFPDCYEPLPVGINEEERIAVLNVFPNPVNNVLFIQGSDISRVELFDITGKMLKECACRELDLHNIDTGVYIVRVTDSHGKQSNTKVIRTSTN